VLGTLEGLGLFELTEDVTKHVILQKVAASDEGVFYSEVKSRIAQSSRRDAFIFIHGYNTSFPDAARRTAQIAYDLKFQGAPIFYSWPSQGKPSKYLVDETNVDWTLPHLVTLLRNFRAKSGAQKVFIIAHSMGGRILTRAVQQLQQNPTTAVKFNQIILAAPDIDRDTFIGLSRAMNLVAERVTLYASSQDRALKLSKQVHGYPRAGDAGSSLVVVPGIDTIDASSVEADFFEHSYFATRTVLSDLFLLFKDGLAPEYRFALFARQRGPDLYWVLP
jgi:esterase/lipase superfamily enzyme